MEDEDVIPSTEPLTEDMPPLEGDANNDDASMEEID